MLDTTELAIQNILHGILTVSALYNSKTSDKIADIHKSILRDKTEFYEDCQLAVLESLLKMIGDYDGFRGS